MRRIAPPAITQLSQIGIAAPASLLDPKFLRAGAEKLASWGYQVRVDERVLLKDFFHAGPDLIRAEIFHTLAQDKNVNAIWCARGGYGVTRILPLLDRWGTAKFLRRQPKLILGYSDITALHLWAWKHLRLRALHCPLVATPKWMKLPPSVQKTLQQLLAGEISLKNKSYTSRWNTKYLGRASSAEGIILGGNLTLLVNMIGTPWQPDLRGSLLFLEDCAEPSYRIDRMITHLRNAGMLNGVRAILAGDFEADVPELPRGVATWKQILSRNFPDIPVLTGLPVGHGKRNEPLPLGVRARITRNGKLELLEQVVS